MECAFEAMHTGTCMMITYWLFFFFKCLHHSCIFKNASNENFNFENSIEAELNDIRSTGSTLYGTRLVFCMDI